MPSFRPVLSPKRLLGLLPLATGVLIAGLLTSLPVATAYAQSAPGEDPLVLTKKVSPTGLPLGNQPRSTGIDKPPELPSWMRAKVSRYTAKAYSANTAGIYTDADVVTTVTTNGFRRSCTQEIATQTANARSSGFGPQAQDQVVVLRGDLVNICN